MKKNAFTMVELLAVIAILGILFLLGFATLTSVLDKSKEQAYQLQLKEMKDATMSFIAENSGKISELWTVGTPYKITLKTLHERGFIELPIRNARTDKNFVPEDVEIIITKLENGTYDIDIQITTLETES